MSLGIPNHLLAKTRQRRVTLVYTQFPMDVPEVEVELP